LIFPKEELGLFSNFVVTHPLMNLRRNIYLAPGMMGLKSGVD